MDVEQSEDPASNISIQPLAAQSIAHLDLESRIGLLLDRMVEIARASSGVVLLASPSSDTLTPRVWAGLAVRPRDERLGEGVVGLVARDGRPAIASDRTREGMSESTTIVLALPLHASDRIIGVVKLSLVDERQLETPDVLRLAGIADHISALIEMERWYDETQRRNAELEKMNAELRELDRLKGEFLSMISHELRTPLTAIIGYTDLLLRQVHGPLNERQRQHQVAVKKASNRLLALINDLLDVTRLESGHVELSPVPVSLSNAFDRAVAQVSDAAAQRGIELRLDVPTRRPIVQADPERLNQILVNLLENAIKFSVPDSEVRLRAERRPDGAHVCVEDTGAGVPTDELERIWNRFYQVDSSSRRRYGGTGLGLAIVRNLVELHRGTVEAHSNGPGTGSTFCFTLPLSDADEPVQPAAPEGPWVSAGRSTAARRRVLIVDDETDNRELIASVVGDVLGYEPILAENGAAAIELARDRPDVILLDLRMPGLNGFEVARRLKQDAETRSIPIVAITALADRDDHDAALQAGCVGWVAKPFSQNELTAAIENALLAEPTVVGSGRD